MRLVTLAILALAVLGFLALLRPRGGAAAMGNNATQPFTGTSGPSKFGGTFAPSVIR